MGRRRTSSAGDIEISLFPFLSILVCLIGALVILIVALSLMETSRGTDDAAINRAQEHQTMVRKIEELRAKADALLRDKGMDKQMARLRELQTRADTLEKKLAAVPKPKAAADKLEKESRALNEAIEKAKAREESLKSELKDAEVKLGQLSKAKPALPTGAPLRILPGGGFARNLSPLFVETCKNELVIHSRTRTVRVPSNKIREDADFATAAKFAADQNDRILVFLIRPDSRTTYLTAQDAARKLGAVTGKVPLDGDGELDLSGFLGQRP